MSSKRGPKDEIRIRIKPTLDKVAVKGLRAWLKAIALPSAAYTRVAITDLVATEIGDGRLAEGALESALIGFEEASDMRVYLFDLDELPTGDVVKWLPNRLLSGGFALSRARIFAGERPKPMSPIYSQLDGKLLRVKWAEQHQHLKLDERTGKVLTEDVDRRIVLIADLAAKTAELRMNPPETRHSYEDQTGITPGERYYQAYKDKVADLLNCTLVSKEWRNVRPYGLFTLLGASLRICPGWNDRRVPQADAHIIEPNGLEFKVLPGFVVNDFKMFGREPSHPNLEGIWCIRLVCKLHDLRWLLRTRSPIQVDEGCWDAVNSEPAIRRGSPGSDKLTVWRGK